jgi:hypothetical protein
MLREREQFLIELLNSALISYKHEVLDVFDYQMDRHGWIVSME